MGVFNVQVVGDQFGEYTLWHHEEPPAECGGQDSVGGGKYYFGGGFLANSTPFSMLPLSPLMQASRSVCSWPVTPPRILTAFSTPFGCRNKMSVCHRRPLLCVQNTYAKLHGGGEELNTGSFSNLLATGDTGQVDESRLDDTLLAVGSLDHGLGKSATGLMTLLGTTEGRVRTRPETGKRHGQSSRSSTILGLDDLIATKLDACGESDNSQGFSVFDHVRWTRAS